MSLFLLGQGVYMPTAQATHFRYGNLSWRQLPSDPTGRTIEFKLTMGFRLGFFTPTPTVGSTVANTTANSSAAFNYGDGSTITTFNFNVTTVNTADDYLYGEATLTHTYATTGTFNTFIESSARLSTLQNNADGRYRIVSTVNVGIANVNLPPASTLPPIINLPLNQAAASFTVPATDPNGNALTFSLATTTDLGATYTFTQPTGLSITSGGVATFDTRSPKAVGQLYNAVIKISDGQSFVVVDFLIRIVAASAPPVFVYGGITPANNSTIQTYVGCPVNFNVQATDTDPTSNTITLQAVGLPPGATFSPATGSNTLTIPFTFTPTTEGTSVTSFFAQDNVGNQVITSVTFRVLQPILTASASVVCVGTPISLTATPGTSASGVTNYTFRGPNGIIGSTSTSNTATVSGLAAGIYSFSVTTSNSINSTSACTSTATTSVTVDAPPTATLTNSGTLTCAITSVTLTAGSSTSAISYAFSGPGLSQTGTANTAVVTQGGTYTVVATTASGCAASATTIVSINTAIPATPILSLVQPGCTLATGTIMITNPTGSSLTYSINGTTYTNTTGIFSGLSPGIYSVTVRNNISTCTSSATSATITSQPPTPVAPTVSVTSQPSCTLTTGTITVTAPTGGGVTYSIDGTTYTNTTGSFSGVSAGTYAVTAKNSAGCISLASSVTVTAQPPTPVAPTVSVTSQPSCTLATGTITVTAPTGAGLTYSIDGTTYTNTTGSFSGVSAGTYAVTVRNSSGCISLASSVTVTAQPPTPVAPTVSVTSQPSCTLATGTITMTAPTGVGLTYSIDGTTYTNSTGSFSGVVAGTYAVTVRNSSGCISPASSITVNAHPPTPVAPTVSVTTQPSCTLAKGTITVTAPTGGGLTYSIDGTTYTNTTGSFSGVSAGTYAVTVRNSSGCISLASSVTVAAQPPTPVLTLNSVSICAGVSTTLTVSGCAGGTLRWSTGDNTTSIIVSPVITTAYSATCTNATGCSATISTTVTIRPTPSYARIPTVTPSTCSGSIASNTGRIDFTSLQNTERADIMKGNTYANGPAYGASTNQPVTAGAIRFGSLLNPTASQPYTIRLFSASGTCFTDVVVILDPVNCQCPAPNCVMVSISP